MTGTPFVVSACGDDGVRIACGAGPVRHALARHLRRFSFWIDIVPGKQDVTVMFDLHTQSQSAVMDVLRQQLAGFEDRADRPGRTHLLPAEFGGAAGRILKRCAPASRSGRAI